MQQEEQPEDESSVFVKYSKETSFSGLKYVGMRGNATRRLIWLLVVLLALSGLVYQIVNCTDKFIRRPSSTKLTYEKKDELDFPAVTICNTNMFRLDTLGQVFNGIWPAYTAGIPQIQQLFPSLQIGEDVGEDVMYDLPDEYPGNMSLYEFIVKNAHTKEGSIKLCRFNGKSCNPENFTTTITNYGVCFTFNSIEFDQPQKVRTPGQLRGLGLMLDAKPKQNVPAPRLHSGFKVLLHPKDEIANLQDFGIELDIGKHTAVGIKPKEIERLPDPYGDCIPDNKGHLKYLSGQYTDSKCFLECETDVIVANCGCRTFYMPGNATFCEPHELVGCFYATHEYFHGRKNDECDCPSSCSELKYSTSVSQATFPSHSVSVMLALRHDLSYERKAFNEAIMLISNHGYNDFAIQKSLFILQWLEATTTKINVTLKETFPDAFADIHANITISFEYIFPEIALLLADFIYDQVSPYILNPVNISYGSEIYLQTEQQYIATYLHSGWFKVSLANGLVDAYNSSTSGNVSFDEYVDYVYDEFDIEAGFYEILAFSYQGVHDYLLQVATPYYAETDLLTLTTEYMRKNFAYVEIYFGDLEIERIVEQKDYELFQFICDWGGALGLFFGASLLSFIETIDFFCYDYMREKMRKK
ncbi:acid-sensing ion channel 5-like [Amphiura filiformis]|uniref:acid-sensing ion channel 5-like n=1 Tax=Amphiura filiformis TaxID=82378 RepID=UPI003B213A0F